MPGTDVTMPPADLEFDSREAMNNPGWPKMAFIENSLAGDPITHLRYSPEAHAHAARRLRALADRYADGRVVAMGGGGYNRSNLARAWTRVVEELAS